MTFRRIVLPALLAAAIVAGLVIKTARYRPLHAAGEADGLAAITALMLKHGWREVPGRGAGYPFTYASFVKEGCGRPLIVAVLGDATELIDDVKLALGPDVGLLERGQSPDAVAPALPGTLGSWLSGHNLVAVSPAPASTGGLCAGPTAAEWSRS